MEPDTKIKPGSSIEITIKPDGKKYTGILMERPELADCRHIIIKLKSGYNIGIKRDRISDIRVIGSEKKKEKFKLKEHKKDPDKPTIAILATGGTIASRVDYLTGGVHSAFSADELISAIPELAEIANVRGKQIFNKFSENMVPGDWIKIANAIAEEIKTGCDGIVIAHGTDTLGYTAAALSFMINPQVPVVLTGAQRSSDRGSSDSAMNMINSTYVAANGNFGEICVVMHGESSDSFSLIHPGTRVRKLHSSRRDAFKTVNAEPIGRVKDGVIEYIGNMGKYQENDLVPEMKNAKSKSGFKLDAKLDENVFLLKYFPGLKPEFINNLADSGYNGIVIEGTGLGHVPESFIDPIKNAIDSGISIAMTSQTLYGRVNMNVYSTGRLLLNLGVIPCCDMLPETAYVKLMWLLAKTRNQEEIKKLMLTDFAGEITERSLIKNLNSAEIGYSST